MQAVTENPQVNDAQKSVIDAAIDFLPENTDTNLLVNQLNSQAPVANASPEMYIVGMFRNPGANRLRELGDSNNRTLRQEMINQLNERFATEQEPTPFARVDLQRQEELGRTETYRPANRGGIFRQYNIEDRLIEDVINQNANETSTIMRSGTLLERLHRNNIQANEQPIGNQSTPSISNRLRQGITDDRNTRIQPSNRIENILRQGIDDITLNNSLEESSPASIRINQSINTEINNNIRNIEPQSNVNDTTGNIISMVENDRTIRDTNRAGRVRDTSLINRDINNRAQARDGNGFSGRIRDERSQDGNSRSR